MHVETLSGGFSNPAVDAAFAFRSVMEAMARPGSIQTVVKVQPPAALSPAAGATLLTLCDAGTPVYLAGRADCADVRTWLAFHSGAPAVGPAHAVFAVGTWEDLMPLSAYQAGAPEYPDRSATLIVERAELSASGARLRGPGIKETARLSLPETEAFQSNRKLFPLGLDFIFTSGSSLAALPRSTEVS